MSSRTLLLTTLAIAALKAPNAFAAGGNYAISGGTPAEQAQVRAALNASSFNWSLLPQQIQVTIEPGVGDYSTPGLVYLDPALLDMGQFSWGIVQHEFGHQVDFQLLNDSQRAQLAESLGGSEWWPDGSGSHSSFTCERFASMIAWAYWPSPSNSLRPLSPSDEAGAIAPAAFRTLLAQVLDEPALAATPAVVPPDQVVYAPQVSLKTRARSRPRPTLAVTQSAGF